MLNGWTPEHLQEVKFAFGILNLAFSAFETMSIFPIGDVEHPGEVDSRISIFDVLQILA